MTKPIDWEKLEAERIDWIKKLGDEIDMENMFEMQKRLIRLEIIERNRVLLPGEDDDR